MDAQIEHPSSFGYWLRRRRKALDLTQEELAERVSCSRFAIRKIEADERRPSKALAERLADRLAVPNDERAFFLDAARGIQAAGPHPVTATPLIAGSPGPDRAGRSGAHAPGDDAQPATQQSVAASLSTLPFVGRATQLGQLLGLIANLAAGRGHVALIEGEPGIGKSRLIGEVVRHTESLGLVALMTSCYEIEQGMPYQPVVELVSQAIGHCGTDALKRLPPASLAEIASLVPTVANWVPGLPSPSAQIPEARQARLFRAIEQLLDTLAERGPFVIVADDVHWVDDASLQFLHTMARHAALRRILLILAFRGEEVKANVRVATLIESLRREAHTRHHALARLTEADTQLLVAATGPSAQAAELGRSLYLDTDGHPFFLVSMMQSIAERGLLESADAARSLTPRNLPEAVRHSVRERLSRVPREARAVLDVAAVIGRRFEFDTLLTAAKLSESALLDIFDLLVQRGLLHEDEHGGIYDFSHDKIREAVYADIGATRRKLLHRTVAEAIEPQAREHIHEVAALLGEHFARAQVWSKALDYLMKAVAHSQRLFATRESLRLLDRAIDILDQHPGATPAEEHLRIREQRGATRAQAGQIEGAVADFEQVLALARSAGDALHERDLLIQLGMTYRRGDSYALATRCLTEALTASRAMQDDRHAADTLYHLGTVAWSNGRNDEAIGHHQEAVEICERLSLADLVAVQAYHGRGEAYFADAQPTPAIEGFARSIALAQSIGDKSYESENLMMIGWANLGSMGLGDYPNGIKHLDAGLAIAQSADLAWHMGPLRIARDHIRQCLGQYGQAWQGLNETLKQLETLHLVRYQIMACNMLGHLLLDLSLNAKACAMFERGLDKARSANITYWVPLLQANRATARMRQGALDVEAELTQALQESLIHREGWFLPRCYEAAAEFHLRGGDAKKCQLFADQLLTLAERGGLREAVARARHLRGQAFCAAGQRDLALTDLRAALETSDQLGTIRLSWDIHQTLGKSVKRPEEARPHQAAAESLKVKIDLSLHGSDLQFGARF